MSSSSDDDSSTDDLGQSNDNRQRRRHDAIYGVFWEHEDSDHGNRKRKRSGNKSSTNKGGMNFVKGSTTSTEVKTDDATRNTVVSDSAEKKDVTTTSTPSSDVHLNDPSAEEDEEKANQYFLSLLAKGKGKNPSIRTAIATDSSQTYKNDPSPRPFGGLGFQNSPEAEKHDEEEEEYYEEDMPVLGAGLGFGKGQSTPGPTVRGGGPLPQSFGRGVTQPPSVGFQRPDPNIAQWEKHTKGIGTKLLAKMGYKGTGGLRPDAMAAPVAVKVRPNNLGLGFGNFKEATSKIQKKDTGPSKKETSSHDMNLSTSAIPTAKEALLQKTWKKRRKGQTKPEASFVPYSDILERKRKGEPMEIIDMTKGETETDPAVVPVGEELLHNIGLLLGTYENRLHSESSFVQTHERQQDSFKADLVAMEKQQIELKDREEKLQTVLRLLDQMDDVLSNTSLAFKSKMQESESIVRQLSVTFSSEERSQIQFSETLIPALVGAVVQPELDAWNPLKEHRAEDLLRAVLQCSWTSDHETDMSEIRLVLLKRYVIPKLKRTWESSKWNPANDMSALDVYETLQKVLKELEQPPASSTDTIEESVLFSDHERKRTELRTIVRDELIDGVVTKRLLKAVGDFSGLFLHDWALPWLQFVAPPNVPAIVIDCKRKIKAIMMKTQQSMQDDVKFFETSIRVLLPWKEVLRLESLQTIMAESVVTRLARFLAKCEVLDAKKATDFLFRMFDEQLLSEMMLLSLLEGELLPNWITYLRKHQGERPNLVLDSYCVWKEVCFGHSDQMRSLLNVDDGVCRCFYAALLLVKEEEEASVQFACTANFRTVLSRRKKQAKRKAADETVRNMEPRAAVAEAQIKIGSIPTFRRVVEELAASHDLVLIPKPGRRVDGKQVFALGSTSVYFDGDVAFMNVTSAWIPVSPEDLMKSASKRSR